MPPGPRKKKSAAPGRAASKRWSGGSAWAGLPTPIEDMLFGCLLRLEDKGPARLVCRSWAKAVASTCRLLSTEFQPLRLRVGLETTNLGKTFSGLDALHLNAWLTAGDSVEKVGLQHMRCLKSLWLRGDRYSDLEVISAAPPPCLKSFSHLSDAQNQPGFTDVHATMCFRRLEGLTSLTLTGCSYLGDETLSSFPSSLPTLTALHISGCYNFTNRGLSSLQALSSLKDLGISRCKQLRNDSLKVVASLTSLTALDVTSFGSYNDAGLQELGTLRGLRALVVAGNSHLIGTGLQGLKDLTDLTRLDMGYCNNITDVGLEGLWALTSLKVLKMGGLERLTDLGFRSITHLRSLEELDASDCPNITDTGVSKLTALTSLRSLRMRCCKSITNAGLAHLTTLKSLNSVDFSLCRKVTSAGLSALLRP